MNSGKYVFSQITDFINRDDFNKCVKRYNGNKGVRDMNCWHLFLQLLFGQLAGSESLRNICIALESHSEKLYHMGIGKAVEHTSLSRANEKREWRIFADFGQYLIEKVRPFYSKIRLEKIDLPNQVFALDSTTISVSINLLSWALGKYSRGAVKIHTAIDIRGNIPSFILVTDGKYHDSNVLDEIEPIENAIYVMDKAYVDFKALYTFNELESFFVTRAKENLKYTIIENNFNIDNSTGLVYDRVISLTTANSYKSYPKNLRLVGYYDAEKDETFEFLTNDFEASALEIANLYKRRWQIEIFFKWIKQNLSIKKLWGHSENAVKIHIWVAIITYLIVAYIKNISKSELTIYQIIEIFRISLFDKKLIKNLIVRDKDKIEIEQPNLFNF